MKWLSMQISLRCW